MLAKMFEDRKVHDIEQRRRQRQERERAKEEARAFVEHVHEVHALDDDRAEEARLKHLQVCVREPPASQLAALCHTFSAPHRRPLGTAGAG